MSTDTETASDDNAKSPSTDEPRQPLSPAAERALQEAAERRKALKQEAQPKEIGGRGGKDPARFGDWEVKGIASDF